MAGESDRQLDAMRMLRVLSEDPRRADEARTMRHVPKSRVGPMRPPPVAPAERLANAWRYLPFVAVQSTSHAPHL